MLKEQSQSQTQLGPSSYQASQDQIEEEIVENVLGKHRGHRKGVGQRLRKDVLMMADADSSQARAPSQQNEAMMATFKQYVEDRQRYDQEVLELLRRSMPGVNIRDPPPPPQFNEPDADDDDDDGDEYTHL